MLLTSDEILMQAIKNGQIEKLSELFRRYRNPVYTFLYRRTNGDQLTAEDVLQDTFERVLRYRSSYRLEQKFKSWVFTIARNALNDHLKKVGKLPITEIATIANVGVTTDSVQTEWEKQEELQQGQAAMASLSSNYREVLELAWKRKLKYSEIATILGTSEGNVKVRMHRACKQLQTNFKKIAR